MMIGARKRKGIENYQLLELRKVVKENKDTVQNDFREKYRELKIESNRGKPAETFYMGKQSVSRQRYNEQRTRRDSQGRDFYEERKGRSDSRGRPYFRRYYRRENNCKEEKKKNPDLRYLVKLGQDNIELWTKQLREPQYSKQPLTVFGNIEEPNIDKIVTTPKFGQSPPKG